MIRIFLISFILLTCQLSSFAHDDEDDHEKLLAKIESPRVVKNIHNFLIYQKNVIKVKDGIWDIKKDLREIYKIEKWSVEKLRQKTSDAEELREGLSYKFARLREYGDEEFSNNFILAQSRLQDVEKVSIKVRNELKAHYGMEVLFKDMDVLIEKANNRVRQLYHTQKAIDNVYRRKRPTGDEVVSDLLRVGFLKRRVRTQRIIGDISKINLEVEEIKRTRKGEFLLFKHTFKNYDITDSRGRLHILKEKLIEIINSLEVDIEEDSVTKKAIFLL